jgi:hypothetical protein
MVVSKIDKEKIRGIKVGKKSQKTMCSVKFRKKGIFC